LECERDGIPGVRVLCAAVDQDNLRFTLTPAKTTELAQSIDGDEEALHGRNRNVEVPLAQVFME
jgi:hypothetical protein